MPRVSFCIPTHDGNAKCQQYLFDIFYALECQTCKDFNVWISDHSKSDKILKACQDYADVFEINFFTLSGVTEILFSVSLFSLTDPIIININLNL